MRWLILSDIHANFEALTSVMADARRVGFERCVVLGDIVGYGASPNEVIELVRQLGPAAVVRGNHDKAASGITEGDTFNDIARVAAMWTRSALTPQNLEYLRGLEKGPIDAGGVVLSHGSPIDEEEYLLGELDAMQSFEEVEFDVACFGHTHFACCFVWSAGRARLHLASGESETIEIEPAKRYLINPGSIGQPRDHNPKAAYAVLDTGDRTLQIRRVAYDVAGARWRIESAGLPAVLGQRLTLGV